MKHTHKSLVSHEANIREMDAEDLLCYINELSNRQLSIAEYALLVFAKKQYYQLTGQTVAA